MMGWLRYDAIGVGEMDLNYGLDKLAEDVDAYDLPLTSINLLAHGDRKPGPDAGKYGTVFPPYLIVKKNGVRFGFVSVIAPSTKMKTGRTTRDGKPITEVEAVSYKISEPVAAVTAVIPEVRKKCDVIILMPHMDREEADALLEQIPPVDLVVLGHDARTGGYGRPEVVAGARMFKATSQGQSIGAMELTFGDNGEILDIKNRIHFLGDEYKDDPDAVVLLHEFDVENRKTQKILFAREQLKSSGDGQHEQAVYLGLGSCQSCHEEQFDVYTGTGHAHAYATLAAQFVHRDTNCVGCHVTGYGEEGGFPGLRYRGRRVDLIDVQCEACHGPGTEHSRDGIYRANAITSCIKCHTKDEDPDFDFATDWAKIAH